MRLTVAPFLAYANEIAAARGTTAKLFEYQNKEGNEANRTFLPMPGASAQKKQDVYMGFSKLRNVILL